MLMEVIKNPIRETGLQIQRGICIGNIKDDPSLVINLLQYCRISKESPFIEYNKLTKLLSFLIILFSLAGIPPMAGFFAKFYIFMSVIEANMYALAVIGLLTTVVSAFYYLRIIKVIYFDRPKKAFDDNYDWGLKGILILSSILILIYFIYPSALTDVVSSIKIY